MDRRENAGEKRTAAKPMKKSGSSSRVNPHNMDGDVGRVFASSSKTYHEDFYNNFDDDCDDTNLS
eukprot:m.106453 g.106453  ORF g.106453 m.106453 type:complete len:65 (-) comp9152_c0_seq1:2407-2601(-)